MENEIYRVLPWLTDRTHCGLEMLIKTSRAAVANRVAEINKSRSTVTIC